MPVSTRSSSAGSLIAVTPVIPAQGSVGASGDLAPLAHMALPLIGRGEVDTRDGRRIPGADALSEIGLAPIDLAAKGGVGPGDVKRYQCWYRNQSTPACGLGVNEFNLSNGFEIVWYP